MADMCLERSLPARILAQKFIVAQVLDLNMCFCVVAQPAVLLNISPGLWGICMYIWQEFLAVLHRKGNFCKSIWMRREL